MEFIDPIDHEPELLDRCDQTGSFGLRLRRKL
jgi:hypothetical protein